MIVPKSASTIDGVPAIISIVDSAARASAKGRPYSLSQTPMPSPTGSAIAIAMSPTANVPINGSRKPPVSLSLNPAAGCVTNRFGRT
jgi:hypothetical protein